MAIFDSWRFSRNYFPKTHLKVIRQFIEMLEKGVKIIYIAGNHDEFLRKFNQTEIGDLKIVNQLVMQLDGEKTWIFHGDIFDHIIHQAKWLAKISAATYGLLTLINKVANSGLRFWFQRSNDLQELNKKIGKRHPPVKSTRKHNS